MTVEIKNFNTDFTRFVDEKIRHVVKVVTSTEIVECSGVILSQHSDVIKKMMESDEEIFLDNYTHVKECLMILHGGSVALTGENCQDILKFAVQFGIPDIVEQALNFIESKVDETCFMDYMKICSKVKKSTAFYNVDSDIDFFWPLEKIIDELESTKVDEFLKEFLSESGMCAILAILMNNTFARTLFKSFITLIDQSNISDVIEILQQSYPDFVDAFSGCPKEDVVMFFVAAEALSLQNRHLKLLLNLKRSIFQEFAPATLGLQLGIVKPSTQAMLKYKSWKKFDKEQMLLICKFNKVDFYLLEIIMSWVTLHKPDLKTVRKLCYSTIIDTKDLTQEYLIHSSKIFNNLGYNISFNTNGVKRTTDWVYFYHLHRSKRVESITQTYNLKSKIRGKVFWSSSCSNVNNNFHCKKSKITVDSSGVKFQCFEDTEGTQPREYDKEHLLYARTIDGKHVPFYTDVLTAVTMECDPKTLNVLWI